MMQSDTVDGGDTNISVTADALAEKIADAILQGT